MDKINDIKNVLGNLRKDSIRLCHNDLNNLNIMITNHKKVFFIDYEYSRYNYIAYDIADLLDECAFDYTVKKYPGFEVR
jgi:choline/ethanolamine kinase